jgi:protein-tyrosine-phosphatase
VVSRRNEGDAQLADQQGEGLIGMTRTQSLAFFIIGTALQFGAPALAADVDGDANETIVFVCLHGSVKSQMAAAHFNRIARERGLPYTAVSRGIEVDKSIPTRIRDALSLDGLVPTDDVPRSLTAAEAEHASRVIAFDAVPDGKRGTAEVNYWSDVPPATKDYAAARDAIMRHIDRLVPALTTPARPRQMLQGVVTAVDERNDRITVRSTPDTDAAFKVQDGLFFDAARRGDRVELTLETIDGAATIVGLTRE